MPSFLDHADRLRTRFESQFQQVIPEAPRSLYDPVRHLVAAGGKRVRPMLTALCYELTRDDEGWLQAANAIELLHTFTLVHDDIMDRAATRRGLPTVHEEYGTNEAILAGDVMIALAERSLSHYTNAPQMLAEFSLGFLRVCEGQAYDKEYEERHDVYSEDYLHMIDLKTAKIAEAAAVLGTLAAGDTENIEAIRSFAHHVGIAFQIQDDLLDLTADQAEFGKTIGGDILEGKRTLLLLKFVERTDKLSFSEQDTLLNILNRRATKYDIPVAFKAMKRLGVIAETEEAVKDHTEQALAALQAVSGETSHLKEFADWLLKRKH